MGLLFLNAQIGIILQGSDFVYTFNKFINL